MIGDRFALQPMVQVVQVVGGRLILYNVEHGFIHMKAILLRVGRSRSRLDPLEKMKLTLGELDGHSQLD